MSASAAIPRTPCSALLLLGATLLAVPGCEREHRDFREVPPGASATGAVRTSDLQPGPPRSNVSLAAYQENAWALSEGKRLYAWFNCSGCHGAGGGGAMGPPLIDAEWIYGSQPENVFASIVEGRPNGMPAFQGRIGNAEVWKLVAYVRSLGGLTRRDLWPGRGDQIAEANPDWTENAERTERATSPPEQPEP